MIEYYFLGYSILVVLYLIYRNALILCSKEEIYQPNEYTFSIIIPSYNERKGALRECIESCVKTIGEKQVIVVDDGSSNPHLSLLSEMKQKYGIQYIILPENRGKNCFGELFRLTGHILVPYPPQKITTFILLV